MELEIWVVNEVQHRNAQHVRLGLHRQSVKTLQVRVTPVQLANNSAGVWGMDQGEQRQQQHCHSIVGLGAEEGDVAGGLQKDGLTLGPGRG